MFELPKKMGQFPAGTIMAAGNGLSGSDPSKRMLDVAYSVDGGKSWAYLSTIAAGGAGRGLAVSSSTPPRRPQI